MIAINRMRAFPICFLLSPLVFATTGLVSRPACGSRWDEFASFLGEMVVKKLTLESWEETKSCFDMTPKVEDIMKLGACFVTSVKKADQANDMQKMPTIADIKALFENVLDCGFKAFEVQRSGKSIDVTSLKAKFPLEAYAMNSEDKTALKTIKDSCIQNLKTTSVVEQAINLLQCLNDGMIKSCEVRGKSRGILLDVFRGFLALWNKPKCDTVKISKKVYEVNNNCVLEARQKWEADGFSKFGSQEMTVYKNNVKDSMYFLMKYGEGVTGIGECMHVKMGFLDKSTGIANSSALRQTIKNFEGWQEEQQRTVLNAFDKCMIKQNEAEMRDMSPGEKKYTTMMQFLKFYKCFAPKFIESCGINNEIAQFFFPVLNNEFVENVLKDFQSKKGPMAAMHLMPVFRDKINELSTLMKNKF